MLLGRSAELAQLNQYYSRQGSQIVVVYGQKNIGKASLLREFTKDKPVSLYAARSCSPKEQLFQWSREIAEAGDTEAQIDSYGDILRVLTENKGAKSVIVIREFQHLVKVQTGFMDALVSFVREASEERQALIILSSSSVGWVENGMIRRMGAAAHSLSGLLKIKELKFRDCRDFFPGYSTGQCAQVYAVLGGVPGLWACFKKEDTVKDNIIRTILSPTGVLSCEADRLFAEELRETAVYNTILAAIAGGRYKLNELYRHTGFSRAKISVYLKNLMELEIVEKVFSYDTAGSVNAQKGIYRIRNHFIHFYFRFLYPNLSRLHSMGSEDFYAAFVAPGFAGYAGDYFRTICTEFMEEQNRRGNLPFVYERSGEWVGKTGNIDMILQDREGRTMIGLCCSDKVYVSHEDYERLMLCARKAKVEASYVYLFSVDSFDEELRLEARVKDHVRLVSMRDM